MGTKKKNSKNRHKFVVLAVLVLLGVALISFLIWRVTFRFPDVPQPPLKALTGKQGVQLGVHIQLSRLHDPVYPELAASQFGFAVIDGEAHWRDTRPTETEFDFKEPDEVVAYAEKHAMPVQAHHLVWGEEQWLPKWLRKGNYSAEQLRQFQREYIYRTVSHYKGKVIEWSVVNENFSRAKRYYNLKDWWVDRIGMTEQDLDNYFLWAREADPNAKLLLNDFSNEVENEVSNLQYNYIKAAKARGVPIDGLGMQFHVNAADPPNKAAVIKNMQRFNAMGVPVYITEFDVNVNQLKGSKNFKRQVEAQVTYDMAQACRESGACVSFAAFGVSEKNDLLKSVGRTDSHSFMFDSRFRPKPSFFAFREAWL